MRKITQKKLTEILTKHEKWLDGKPDGERAILSNCDLRYVNLSGADLSHADLSGADLRYADLRGADLRYADLRYADLRYADLRYADLRYADLRYADLNDADLNDAELRYADLRYADLNDAELRYADLSGADLSGAENVPYIPMICPEEGKFIGYKKVDKKYIVKLQIPAKAKRSSATTRKCRCEYAKVLDITSLDGKEQLTEIANDNYCKTIYKVGEMVYPDSWDDDRWNECSHGIHFFINLQEAINYFN